MRAARGETHRYSYYIETADQPLSSRDAMWNQRLPDSRRWKTSGRGPGAGAGSKITVGGYLTAVRAFLEGPGGQAAARVMAGGGAAQPRPLDFRIFLAKHGEYYHPCRVESCAADGAAAEFVVNGAVSAAGKALIRDEVAALGRLQQGIAAGWVPRVYAQGEISVPGAAAVALFLAEWFAGFHEFHLTQRRPDGRQGLVVWDPRNGDRFPGEAETEAVYSRAAYILTRSYDLESREGISGWHHAAGDFVVRLAAPEVDLRLISVRGYRPLFRRPPEPERSASGVKDLLQALLLFFLNLTLKMRLDRLDGTGEMAWAADGSLAVRGTLRGFLEALAEKPPFTGLPLPTELLFRHLLLSCGLDDLTALCRDLAASAFAPPAPESALVSTHLAEHAADCLEAASRL